jgi:WW domain-binding protein 2
MTFKDGGAFDFHSIYERIKERLQQAVEVARESGHLVGDGSESGGGQGAGALGAVDMNAVHLDELPAYEDAAGSPPVQAPRHEAPLIDLQEPEQSQRSSPQQERFEPPAEPPPGYAEVQSQSVSEEFERRLRGSIS